MGVVNYKFNSVDAANVDKLIGKERNITSVKRSGTNIMIGLQVRIDTTLDSLTWTTPLSVSEISIDWGDGTITRETANNPSHTYATDGQYDVRFYGVSGDYNYSAAGSVLSRTPVIAILDWTNEVSSSYASHPNLVSFPPTTQPTWGGQQFFASNPVLDGVLDHWTLVGNTQRIFKDCFVFNQPINSWNVSGEISFLETFRNNTLFNQPLSNWDVSGATDFQAMMLSCQAFNQDIGDWRFNDTQKSTGTTNGTATNKLVDTTADFIGDGVSNSDWVKNITTGAMAQVTGIASTELTFATDDFVSGDEYRVFTGIRMTSTFISCSSFNNGGQVATGLNLWNTKNVVTLSSIFSNDTNFNVPCGDWDTSANTNLSGVFSGCVAFNQDVGDWDTSAVVSMTNMFISATVFNNGGVGGVGLGMDKWDTSRCTNMFQVFQNASGFDQYLGGWDTSKVTNFTHFMKRAASATGQGLGNWDVSSCTQFDEMFFAASNINFPITHPNYWEINPGVTTTQNMFLATAMNGGQAPGVSGRNCEFKFSTDPADSTSLNTMLNAIGNEFNQDISTDSVNGYWEMDRVVSMSSMLAGASSFNQNIGNWNVGACESFSALFRNCSQFNNGGSNTISNWDVSSALNMASMFQNCSNFNQPLNWGIKTSLVETMANMFNNADSFNQDISGWDTSSVTSMASMFQNISNTYSHQFAPWSIASLQNASLFCNTGGFLPTATYDAMLDINTGWASQSTIQTGVSLGVGSTLHTTGGDAEAGKNYLTGTKGWTIVDGNP